MQGSPLLMLLAALASTGCGQVSPAEGAGSGEQEPLPSLASLHESAVTWDANGDIDGRFGLMGGWYSYYDCDGQTWRPERPAELGCTKPDPELDSNWNRTPGWSTSAKKVCLKGIAARIESGPGMASQYNLQFGAGLGFDLNHDFRNPPVPCEQNSDCASKRCVNPVEPPDQEPAPGECYETDPYDATEWGVKGFRFDITEGTPGTHAPATLAVRLGVPSVPLEAQHFIKIAVPALNQTVSWAQDSLAPSASEVEQAPSIIDPTPFTPEAISSIEFEVYTNNQAPKPYDFCVSNFRVLR